VDLPRELMVVFEDQTCRSVAVQLRQTYRYGCSLQSVTCLLSDPRQA
jgi:hypothetical protein